MQQAHQKWHSSLIFILAAAGSAVGLGNIWKFPYMVGESGGSAFVLVYLLCILLVGLPILIAEILIGRRGDASPILAMQNVAKESKASSLWAGIGWLGTVAGFLIASFYVVVAGWAAKYTYAEFSGALVADSAETVENYFVGFLGAPEPLLIWTFAFLFIALAVIALGVQNGLANMARVLMPILMVILLGLFAYVIVNEDIASAISFMFRFEPDKLNSDVVLSALGHAFFTLSLGMCAMMVYASYMPKGASIAKSAFAIAILDTAIAIIAGLVIYGIVFAHGLEPSAGPGLLFQSLPLAFEELPYGSFIGGLFFLLVSFAALTSLVSIIEPFVAWLTDKGLSRLVATVIFAVICSVLTVGCALSFNLWSGDEYKIFNLNFFDLLDYLTTNIMLPLGGVLIAIFVGWFMKDTKIRREMKPGNEALYLLWRILIRWVAPITVLIVLLKQTGLI